MENKWRKFSEEKPKFGSSIWVFDSELGVIDFIYSFAWVPRGCDQWMPAEPPQPPPPENMAGKGVK